MQIKVIAYILVHQGKVIGVFSEKWQASRNGDVSGYRRPEAMASLECDRLKYL